MKKLSNEDREGIIKGLIELWDLPEDELPWVVLGFVDKWEEDNNFHLTAQESIKIVDEVSRRWKHEKYQEFI